MDFAADRASVAIMLGTGAVLCKILPKKFIPRTPLVTLVRTFLSKDTKRFYKNVTITLADGGGYEINLDHRKLKTPMGNSFKVPNEALAMAVSQEWSAQQEVIKRHNMQMTLLCNTALDNPTKRSKSEIVDGIINYLETDTVCYRLDEPPELHKLMQAEWDPLLHWIKERYEVQLEPTTGIGVPAIPDDTMKTFRDHLLTFNNWAIIGWLQAVESLKSVVINTALIDRAITVERALQLSTLELQFQKQKWGNVEWHHDVEDSALLARIASATLFVHLNSQETTTKLKSKLNSGLPIFT